MQWYEAPDINEVHDAMQSLAVIRGEILRTKRTIQKSDDSLKAKYPRKPDMRRQESEELYDSLTELEIKEVHTLQTIEFLQMRMKMFQAYMYKRG